MYVIGEGSSFESGKLSTNALTCARLELKRINTLREKRP